MSNKEGNKVRLIPSADGISAGLQIWLFFLFCFVLLRYSIPLSIFMGAVAGLAGGWIVTWLKSKDRPRKLASGETEEPEENSRKVRGLRLAKEQRDIKAKKRNQRLMVPPKWFSRKKK
jgi:hypothetical protein